MFLWWPQIGPQDVLRNPILRMDNKNATLLYIIFLLDLFFLLLCHKTQTGCCNVWQECCSSTEDHLFRILQKCCQKGSTGRLSDPGWFTGGLHSSIISSFQPTAWMVIYLFCFFLFALYIKQTHCTLLQVAWRTHFTNMDNSLLHVAWNVWKCTQICIFLVCVFT